MRIISIGLHFAKLQRRRVGHRLLGQSLNDHCGPFVPRPEAPLIVIGMHRSGTSLLARQLEDLGVDMGKWQGKNTNEAMFFRHRNELLFSLAHATWDNPTAFIRALENPHWRSGFARVAARDLGTIRTLNFLPPRALSRFTRAPHAFWGFKDPRTTLTLPVWCDIFPNAKVIHIVREANAVASSLYRRGREQLQDGLPSSLVSLDLRNCLDLWAEYVLAAHKNCVHLSKDAYMEIRYEHLVHSPDRELRKVASFIGLNSDSARVEKAASRVNHIPRRIEISENVSPKARKALRLYNYSWQALPANGQRKS